jgi:WD40 repeat protein
MGEDTNTHPQPDKTPQDTAAHIEGDYVDGDKITGDIAAEGVSGSGHHIGHRIYKDPNYPYDVRGLANPYLGLAAFTYAEREKYAGRERVVARAVELLTNPGEQRTLLFITGASGSGKSSLAQAGLLPALERHYGSDNLHRAVFRPSQHPIDSLLDALQRQVRLPIQTLERERLPQAFSTFLGQHIPSPQVLTLIIDQFEELFSQADHAQRDQLFALLTSLPLFADLHTHIIATVRADYLPELFAHQALYDEAKRGIDLRVMTEDALRQAIQQPLIQHPDAKDKRFEDALLDRLASDAAADAAYLPLLQVTLARIWSGGLLKLSAYGTLTDAIQQQAEEVYTYRPDGTPRPEAEQQTILALLLELVDVSPTDDDRRDVRRRCDLEAILHNAPERRGLVTELATARLLSTGRETRAGDDVEVVDIIHESLLGNWARLKHAIDTERETLQRRARFDLALHEWHGNGQQDAYLLMGVRLSEAETLDTQGDVALRNPAAQELLKRSVTHREERRKREVRRLQVFAGVLTVLLLLAMGASWFAFEQQQEAEANANERATAQVQAEANANERATAQVQAEASAVEVRNRLLTSDARVALDDGETSTALTLAMTAAHQDYSLPAVQAILGAARATAPRHAFSGHTMVVSSVAFSPDGQYALSGSWDTTLRLWEVATGEQVRIFEGHKDAVYSVAFSPDGQYALSGSCGEHDEDDDCIAGELRLWDVTTGETMRIFEGHEGRVSSVAFSPNGKYALSGSLDGMLRLWDVATGDHLRVFEGHEGRVSSVAFSPDGQTALSGSCGERNEYDHCISGELRLWNVATGKAIRVFKGHKREVNSVAFSSDGQTALSGSRDSTLRLWAVATGEQVRVFEGHEGLVNSVAFSPDGQTALSGAGDGTLRLWDIETGEVIRVFRDVSEGELNNVHSVAFSPNGKSVLSGSADRMLRLWDVAIGEQVRVFEGHEGLVGSVAFSPDGQYALSGSCGRLDDNMNCITGESRLWDVQTGEDLRVFQGHEDGVTSVAFSPDGRTALSGSWDTTLRLWEVATGEQVRIFEGHEGRVSSVAFSPDGWYVLSGSGDGTVRLWDVQTGEELRVFQGYTNIISSVAFSPDGRYALSGSGDGTLRLWDVATGEQLRVFEGHEDGVKSVAFGPDGRTALSGSWDTTLRLWEVATGEQVRIFEGHEDTIYSVAFSPGGQYALSGSCDERSLNFFDFPSCIAGELRLWNIATWQEWTCANRHVFELTDRQRAQYGLPDDLVLCPDE